MNSFDPRRGNGPGSPPTSYHASTGAQAVAEAADRVIAGQRPKINIVLAALLSGGHVLLEDRPGVGKTVLARAIGAALNLGVSRIQGTPDLLPTDVTGVHIYHPGSDDWKFKPGPLFAPLVLVDELNRATPKAQSALLEAMAENQVTVDGATLALPEPFMVLATQNPLGEVGTHRLAAAQLDRFAVLVRLGLPERAAERAVLTGAAGQSGLNAITPVVTDGERDAILRTVRSLPVSDAIIDYTLDIVHAVRASHESIWLSVRVSETLLTVARGHAVLAGRAYVAPEDIQAVAVAVFEHRLPKGIEPSLVKAVLNDIAIPVHG